MKRVILDVQKCTGCRLCAKSCPFGALKEGEKGLLYAPARCVRECGLCQLICPQGAVSYGDCPCAGRAAGEEKKCAGCSGCGALCSRQL